MFESTDNQVNRGRIGAIIEQPAFYPYMTAYENLQYYIKFKGIVEANSIENVLKMVGLENAATKKYKNYSLGMKQRLGLALALINNPDLLILDEPLNGLDPQGIAELRETLRHLNKKYGITMVISSHILDELEMIATRYGFIHKGHMIEEITVDELHEKLKKYISLDVENISLATITIEQKLNNWQSSLSFHPRYVLFVLDLLTNLVFSKILFLLIRFVNIKFHLVSCFLLMTSILTLNFILTIRN